MLTHSLESHGGVKREGGERKNSGGRALDPEGRQGAGLAMGNLSRLAILGKD